MCQNIYNIFCNIWSWVQSQSHRTNRSFAILQAFLLKRLFRSDISVDDAELVVPDGHINILHIHLEQIIALTEPASIWPRASTLPGDSWWNGRQTHLCSPNKPSRWNHCLIYDSATVSLAVSTNSCSAFDSIYRWSSVHALNLHIPWHPLAPETNNIYITGGSCRMPMLEPWRSLWNIPHFKQDFHHKEGKQTWCTEGSSLHFKNFQLASRPVSEFLFFHSFLTIGFSEAAGFWATERFSLTGFLSLSLRICHLQTWHSGMAYFSLPIYSSEDNFTWELETKHWRYLLLKPPKAPISATRQHTYWLTWSDAPCIIQQINNSTQLLVQVTSQRLRIDQ